MTDNKEHGRTSFLFMETWSFATHLIHEEPQDVTHRTAALSDARGGNDAVVQSPRGNTAMQIQLLQNTGFFCALGLSGKRSLSSALTEHTSLPESNLIQIPILQHSSVMSLASAAPCTRSSLASTQNNFTKLHDKLTIGQQVYTSLQYSPSWFSFSHVIHLLCSTVTRELYLVISIRMK